MPEQLPTTLAGFVTLCVLWIVYDWIKSRGGARRDVSKEKELKRQTKWLKAIWKQKKKANEISLANHQKTHTMLTELIAKTK